MPDIEHDSPDTGRTHNALVTPLRVLATCAVIVMLQYLAPVVLPIVLAVLLFYALDPIVDRLETWRVPRALASMVVVFSLVGATGWSGTLIWPQMNAVLAKVPASADRLRSTLRRQRSRPGDSAIDTVRAATKALDSVAAEAGAAPPSSPGVTKVEVQQPVRVSDWLWYGGVGAASLSAQAITVIFLTIFLLNEDDSFKRKLVQHQATLGSKRVTVKVLNDIAAQMQSFLWVQVLTSVFVAVVTVAALWWLGVEEPVVWGVFAGVMNIVPYFGPLVVTVALALVGFLQFGTLTQAAMVAGVALVITTFEGMFLTPHLLSKAAAINHVAIFVSIAFWSWAWGVPGMLLAVPMLMAAKAVCDHVDGYEAIGSFLGE
ncbi:MAG: AI-2E family transporter [Acidobacteriota bacterium]